jgi:hypothetical protein
MPRYLVTWTIDIDDAETPYGAAEAAFRMMQEPGTECTCFEVYTDGGKIPVAIDLMNAEDEQENESTTL